MSRNLNDRVESIIEVQEDALRRRLIDILTLALDDRRTAWTLQPGGQYVQPPADPGEQPAGYQERLMRHTRRRVGHPDRAL